MWGLGDWEQAYLTLDPAYEAAQVEVFGQMALKGYIYRGLKPVHWSPSSRTALAEAELEYPDGHVSPSIYALMPLTELTPAAQAAVGNGERPYLAIWTTTPWTLPGNLAVAVHPEVTYAVVTSGSYPPVIVAAALVEKWQGVVGQEVTVTRRFPGKVLEFCHYQHPLFDRQGVVVLGSMSRWSRGRDWCTRRRGMVWRTIRWGKSTGCPCCRRWMKPGALPQRRGVRRTVCTPGG